MILECFINACWILVKDETNGIQIETVYSERKYIYIKETETETRVVEWKYNLRERRRVESSFDG